LVARATERGIYMLFSPIQLYGSNWPDALDDTTAPGFGRRFGKGRMGTDPAALAAFGARAYPNTKKWYGTSGNSFVAVVEFGDSVRAQAITAGGESGSPQSPHFNDEAERYASGRLRDVYFYRPQLVGHTERTYHP
ncbi:MAG TPA: penicillin acylase family protein, partial [Gemmatimonadales bacterium]